jgi:hypothetical protein
MGILLGLAPFIAFFVLMRLVSPLAGLAAGFVVSLLLGVRVWRRGETIKILEIGSLILFAGLTLYALVAQPEWSVATVRLVVDAGLLAIVLVSLAIGRPFTPAICSRAGAESILGGAALPACQSRDHVGLGRRFRGAGRCRCRGGVCARDSGDGRCRRFDPGDRRRDRIHVVVSGKAAACGRFVTLRQLLALMIGIAVAAIPAHRVPWPPGVLLLESCQPPSSQVDRLAASAAAVFDAGQRHHSVGAVIRFARLRSALARPEK